MGIFLILELLTKHHYLYKTKLNISRTMQDNQQPDDPFYKLFKDKFQYIPNKPVPEQRSMEDLYSKFKAKTNVFQQRIAPDIDQKREIIHNALENNVNYITNYQTYPDHKMKATLLENIGPIIVTESPELVDQISYSPTESVHSYQDDPIEPVLDYNISPLKPPQNHLEDFTYKKKTPTRQLTLAELLQRTGKIKKRTEIKAEKKPKDDEKMDEEPPQPKPEYKVVELKPKEPTKEEQLAKLKDELKTKSIMAKQREKEIADEIRRKAVSSVLC